MSLTPKRGSLNFRYGGSDIVIERSTQNGVGLLAGLPLPCHKTSYAVIRFSINFNLQPLCPCV